MPYIARILYPVKVLGPGNRIGIWFCGCSHRCKGCSNPELWEFDDKYNIAQTDLMSLIRKIANKNKVDGFTITGGDPFEQPEALEALLKDIVEISDDILVYSGYTYDEIKASRERALPYVSVIIDGRYEEENNKGEKIRGSTNQNIIILKEKYRDLYSYYLSDGENQIQNFYLGDSAISVGIHNPGYEKDFDDEMKKRGLVANE